MNTLSLPLCVDMDETLIHSDVLLLGITKLATSNPWLLPWFIVQLCVNRAKAKAWLARTIDLDVTTFPYRAELLDYLRQQKMAGRRLILVSAADEHLVKRVADHIGVFDAAYGSDGHINLKGRAKAHFIKTHIAERFVYAGDSCADLQVWSHASGAIVCGKARLFQSILSIPVEASFQ